MRLTRTAHWALMMTVGVALTGCEGPAGAPGTSCSIADNGDGSATISCTDGSAITVENGKDGTNGTDGTDGTDGADGADGSNGSSCTVTDNLDGTKTIACEDGTTVTVSDGTDGKSCTVVDNGDGTDTITCSDGTSVTVSDGADGKDLLIENFHGGATLAEEEFETAGMYLVTADIQSATADSAGKVTVDFTVKDADSVPVTDVPSVSLNIAKLVPAKTDGTPSQWVSYNYQTVTAGTGAWPLSGNTTVRYQAYKESNTGNGNKGTLTNHHDGSYTYVFATNVAAVTTPAVTYDRHATHRVGLMMGGHTGATASAYFDFVPDGTPIVDTRNLI